MGASPEKERRFYFFGARAASPMTDYRTFLLKLNDTLNTLREREAKYAGNPPVDLLNQIADHGQAITITHQALSGELTESEWQAALKPLLVFPPGTPVYEAALSPLSPAEAKERRDLGILLNKVKTFWVEGVLEHSVHNMALIDLGKETQAEAVVHAWEQVLELPDQSRQTLPPDKKISKIFDEMNRALLILGAPGSGKTVTLLQLARGLIAQAESDESFTQPIPVVFNLSSWEKGRSFLDWLMAELSTKYQIPQRIGRKWLENNRLLPLLDGLDEVKQENREACVEAINQFGTEVGLSGLAVCSRLEEYRSLSTRLRLSGAIRLQPLTLEQVYAYLNAAGAKLDALRMALQENDDLQLLARLPLMLGIMSLAYQDLSVEALQKTPKTSFEARRKQLFDVYIERMFKRKGSSNRIYPDNITKYWLSWLAQKMTGQNQTIFLIEQLQPTWLETRCQQWLFYSCCGIFIGLLTGLIFGLITTGLIGGITMGINGAMIGAVCGGLLYLFDLFFAARFNRLPWIGVRKWIISGILGLVSGLLIGALFGFMVGMYIGPFLIDPTSGEDVTIIQVAVAQVFGGVGGLIGVLIGGLIGDIGTISPVDALKWSWKSAGRGFISVGMVIVVIIILALVVLLSREDLSSIGPMEILETLLLGIIIFVIMFGTPVSLMGGLVGGTVRVEVESTTTPNQGIRQSIKNAGLIFVAWGVIGGLILYPLNVSIQYNMMAIAMVGGLIFGGRAVIQHLILRILLYRRGFMAWKYASFLDYCADRIFLQKVGGGYIFIHRLLMEHFASLTPADIERLTQDTPGRQPA